jgi:hypothetical protein
MAAHDRNAEDNEGRYRTFAAFYPFYLTEHLNRTSRRLHVVGTTLVIAAAICGFLIDWRFFVAAPLVGYGFAWLGHFVFEKNRPATLQVSALQPGGRLSVVVRGGDGQAAVLRAGRFVRFCDVALQQAPVHDRW